MFRQCMHIATLEECGHQALAVHFAPDTGQQGFNLADMCQASEQTIHSALGHSYRSW